VLKYGECIRLNSLGKTTISANAVGLLFEDAIDAAIKDVKHAKYLRAQR